MRGPTMGFQLANRADEPKPRPEFAEWLADPNAQAVALAGQDQLLEWIAETWDDSLVEPLTQAIDERNADHNHGFIAMKKELGCDPWKLGRTHPISRQIIVTEIHFATTDEYLEGDD